MDQNLCGFLTVHEASTYFQESSGQIKVLVSFFMRFFFIKLV